MSSRGTAHPRSRGEHTLGDSNRYLEIGSSPLARGTPSTRQFVAADERLIPARAGNTLKKPSRLQESSAHPRSRGEHFMTLPTLLTDPGSSPLARGTHRVVLLRYFCTRLIPARAGNTWLRFSFQHTPAAHPRSRGEHTQLPCTVGFLPGSSPLARGTRNIEAEAVARVRLIPARAGNTSISLPSHFLRAAHPRSRGEHSSPHSEATRAVGSSPLARGTP